MFNITGEDIAQLGDADLRTLVARLAQAEVARRGGPVSAVTAGGPQDAGDGGIDVRVELPTPTAQPDFVPRAQTGFQVKKPPMTPSAIGGEMRPTGTLRAAIAELAEKRGAYLIVSGATGVTDVALARRRTAMREAVADHPKAGDLHLDFYDRDRLAAWADLYPGVAAWVRGRVGRPLAGWRPIGRWRDLSTATDTGYLIDEGLTLIDERDGAKVLPIEQGLALLRDLLRRPGACVRLIGLSGVGKTRLVEALFEDGVGSAPLDPGSAIYADYADATTPSAQEMAQRLDEAQTSAILIIDNCNPATHSRLAQVCGRPGSRISLLTVEYDIRDDEPEATQVVRLVASSEPLVETWLGRDFPHVSQLDRGRIATFSGGNFRVARALAGALRVGESLGRLRDRDLFERIFRQRNDPDQTLLRDAETLALFYSFEGVDDADGELARIGRLQGRMVADLFGTLAELKTRGVLQTRGKWRAILPHAIANPLAAGALGRLPPAAFDAFAAALPERMFRSLTRRLGQLHDVDVARDLVQRWLDPTGPAGDLLAGGRFDLLINLAPVAPRDTLDRLTAAVQAGDGPRAGGLHRGSWNSLIKAIAYDVDLFAPAARLLASLVAREAHDENYDSARGAFEELFHLYLSGSQASPADRRAITVELLRSDDPGLRRAGGLALDGLLQEGHFSSSHSLDFGARPRDFGWHPTTTQDVSDWYEAALGVARTETRRDEQRVRFAGALRGLWRYPACRTAFEAAAADFEGDGGWLEGWSALRMVLRYDAEGMPTEVRQQTDALIDRLKPDGLLARARAWVVSPRPGLWEDDDDEEPSDSGTSWERANDRAAEIGAAMASDEALLAAFIPEVMREGAAAIRDAPFARGVAGAVSDLQATWTVMTTAYRVGEPARHSPVILAHFLAAARARDDAFVEASLEAAAADPDLAGVLAYLQFTAGLDARGIDRLLRAMDASDAVESYQVLGRVHPEDVAPADLARLLARLAQKPGGVTIGLDALSTYFYPSGGKAVEPHPALVVLGRDLFSRMGPEGLSDMRNYSLRYVVRPCLSGVDGEAAARRTCEIVRSLKTGRSGWKRGGNGLAQALFEVQPEIALDVFMAGPDGPVETLFRERPGGPSPLNKLDVSQVVSWADRDPAARYAALGTASAMFLKDQGDRTLGLNPLFVTLLEHSPDKQAFLGSFYDRLAPRSWSGSLAEILDQRRRLLDALPDHPDVQTWREAAAPQIARWIATERENEAEREESFE
ncbi:hypothetical protein [Brevundimonas sp.]|uniref:hypothetical protein n=1 Tax=Brevundimonas sp. TaxID=1871086 RepID=UPI003D151E10